MAHSTINVDAEAVKQFINKMRGYLEDVDFSIKTVLQRTQEAGDIWRDGTYEKVSECIEEIVQIVKRFSDDTEELNKHADKYIRSVDEYHKIFN